MIDLDECSTEEALLALLTAVEGRDLAPSVEEVVDAARAHLDGLTAAREAAPVLTLDRYPSNGHLIAAAHRLGWIRDDDRVLDTTYGLGTFWSVYRPEGIHGTDLNPEKSETGRSVDYHATGFDDRSFDVVVFDPPYKLSGTPALDEFDERYGIEYPTRWQDRMTSCRAGAVEAARVADRTVLIKCMDQVVSGRRVWQTREFADAVLDLGGWRLVDRLDYHVDPRPQPGGRRQVHSLANYSTLLRLDRTTRKARP